MKKLLILFVLIACLIPFTANATKVTDYTAETNPDTADLLWLTVDVSTTAADRKITLGNLLLWMATQDWTTTGTWDMSSSTVTWPATITTTTFVGALTGNADTATALAANGANCSSGQAPLGVDASGAVESCFAVVTVGADNNFTGSNTLSKVNAAGGSADVLTLSGTLGIMDGSDTFRGIYLNYTNADHTGSSNAIYGIQIAAITGDAQGSETAIQVGSGWDEGISSYSPILALGDGSTTKGSYYLYDLDNSAYVAITPADETTSWTMTLPATEPTGLLRADAGTISTTTSITGLTFGGFSASLAMATDGSGNATTLSTQNVITTGQIDGKVKVSVVTGTTTIDTTSANQAVYYINGADSARTFNLPAAAAGLAYCFANALYAQAITVHPASGDYIILAGENNDSSDVVSLGAATDKICVLGIDTTYWLVTASAGTWAND